jgi:hypothetical protein
MRCTLCGEEIEAGFRFCKNCGSPAPTATANPPSDTETNIYGATTPPAFGNQSAMPNQTISMGDSSTTDTPNPMNRPPHTFRTREAESPYIQEATNPYQPFDSSKPSAESPKQSTQRINPPANAAGQNQMPTQPVMPSPYQEYQQPYQQESLPQYGQNSPNPYAYSGQGYGQKPTPQRKNRLPLIIGLITSLAIVAAGSITLYFWLAKKAPKVRDIGINLSRIQQGDKVTLTAQTEYTDANSKFQWLTSAGRISSEGASATLDTTTIDASAKPSDVKITLTVTNENGETSFEKSLIVYRNENTISSPLVVVLQADQTSVREGETVNFTAEVSNRDDKDVSYEWQASEGVIKNDGKTATLTTSGLNVSQSPHPISVTVVVKDRTGNSQSDMQLINVVAADVKNFPPSINIRAAKMNLQPGEEVDLFADATDRDGDTVTITWSAAQGQIIGKGNRVRLKTPPNAQGQIAVTATAVDTNGNASKDSITLNVVAKTPRPPDNPPDSNPPAENHFPTINRLYADKNPVRAGEQVTVRVEASDPDNDNLVYAWSNSQGSIIGGANGASITLDTSNVDTSSGARQVFVRVAVNDQRGGAEVRTMTLTVLPAANQPPRRDTEPPTRDDSNPPRDNQPPSVRQPGRLSGSVSVEDQETVIVAISGNPGTPQSSSGVISVTVSGGSVSVTGYLPDTTCIYRFGNAVNIKDGVRGLSMVEPPKGSNGYSRLRVRLKLKERNQAASFTVVWSKP